MNIRDIPQRYSYLQAWVTDHLVADRALNLHAYLIEYGKLADVLAAQGERRVLDVGCGGGQFMIRMKELYPHLRLAGIDLSADQIARARQRAQRRGYTLQFEIADAQALPFPDASFDVVFSFGSAKHWPDPLQGMGECWRVLKPGGELLVADATSDATKEQVINFYRMARFPRLFQKPVTHTLYERMFRHARPVETYRQIADQLGMPQGTVSHLPSMPVFLFRTQKPQLPGSQQDSSDAPGGSRGEEHLRYRAIFLDRDGVLCRNSAEKAQERDQAIGEIIGRQDFHVTPEMNRQVFWRVREQPGLRPVNTLAREEIFWKKWYQLILQDYGVGPSSEVLATELSERFCFHKMMELYPETPNVLAALKAAGYRLGVISDTFPSLQASLEALGIAGCFDSFTASSLVGAGKPDPRIFAAATQSLDVQAHDSIFIDDNREEADGAREQGFTAFHLDRERQQADFGSWTLGNLEHLLDFLKGGS